MFKYFVFLGLCLFAGWSFVWAGAPEALQLINQTEENLEKINVRLQLIEAVGIEGIESEDLVISVPEIKTKVEATYSFLDQAILYFNQEDYETAFSSAFEAKENSDLAVFYLDALLRDARRFNLSELFLQGDLVDLLDLRNLLRINNLIVLPDEPVVYDGEEEDETPPPPPSAPISNVEPEPEPETDIPPETEAEEEGNNNQFNESEEGSEDPNARLVCLEQSIQGCEAVRGVCLDSLSQPETNCTAGYQAVVARCNNIFGLSRSNSPILGFIGNIFNQSCLNWAQARVNVCERNHSVRVRNYDRQRQNCQTEHSRCVGQAQVNCAEL